MTQELFMPDNFILQFILAFYVDIELFTTPYHTCMHFYNPRNIIGGQPRSNVFFAPALNY